MKQLASLFFASAILMTGCQTTQTIPARPIAVPAPNPTQTTGPSATDVQLAQVLAQQQKQIAQLQNALAASQAAQSSAPITAPPLSKTATPMSSSGNSRGWMQESNWRKLRKGVSSEQAIMLLGTPTRREQTTLGFKLFWEGEVPGSGRISGNVEFSDNQIKYGSASIHPPVFL